MNSILATRADVDIATKYLQDNELVESGISCKNWEIAQILPLLKDGDLIDLGSDGSVVLPNAIKLGLKGRKVGIDLLYKEDVFREDVELYKGDLMDVPFVDNSFDTITCLSVVEHDVKYNKIAKEVGRLLRKGGDAFISCDFWIPKPDTSKTRLYDLNWNILDKNNAMELIDEFKNNGMKLTSEVDWTTNEAVINSTYCSPVQGVSYSFLILHFIKK